MPLPRLRHSLCQGRLLAACAVTVALAAAPRSVSAQNFYSYHVFAVDGPFGGVGAINSAGQIALTRNGVAARREPNGTETLLGTLSSSPSASSVANGINGSGTVVGNSVTDSNVTHGFVTNSSGGLKDIGTLANRTHFPASTGYLPSSDDDYNSSATAINAGGLVTGASDQIDGTPFTTYSHAFLYDPTTGTMTDLGSLTATEETNTAGTAINALGHVAGYGDADANGGGTTTQAFLHDAAGNHVLGTLTDSDPSRRQESYAFGLNDSDVAAGYSYYDNVNFRDQYRAVEYLNGQVINLGVLGSGGNSYAFGINNSGAIIGQSEVDALGALSHGFVYQNGALFDLNDLVTPGSGLTIVSALSIADNGAILGLATDAQNNYFGIVLTPNAVPEPGTVGLLLGIVATSAGLLRQRRRAPHRTPRAA